MATNTDLVQQLYVAYFNRPADVDGLAYYKNILDNTAAANIAATVATISADFANATEYKAIYANMSAKDTINTIYHNLFGHQADIPGLNYWANLYTAGTVTLANIVTAVAGGAQGTDLTAFNNKVTASESFTSTISLSADEMLAYAKGGTAIDTARSFLSSVTDDASLTTALSSVANVASGLLGSVTSALTTGVDTIVGTSGNDVINGSDTTFTALDSIDGAGGTNTLALSDVTGDAIDLSIASVKNIQNLSLTSTKGLGAAGVADVSGWAGLTSATFNLNNIGTHDQSITAAGTTATIVNAKGAIATTALTVNGGLTDTVMLANGTNDNSAKSINVNGVNGTTTVTVSQSVTTGKTAAVAVADDGSKTITNVSLSGLKDAAATVASDALTTLTVASSAQDVTVTAAAGTRTLNLNLNKDTAGTITDATATTLNVNAVTAKSSGLTVSAAAATSVAVHADVDLGIATLTAAAATGLTIAGAGDVTIGAATLTALKTVDATAATGDVTITPALGTGVAYSGGSGVDTITVGATTKAIALGAGNDVVVVTGALGTGGSIDGGDGVDILAGTGANIASLLGDASVAKVTNFETLKITDALANASSYDVSAVAGVTNFVAGDGVATGGTASVTNLGAGATVTLTGDLVTNNGTLNIGTKVDGSADVINLTIAHTLTDNNDTTADNTAVTATVVATTHLENLNVDSTIDLVAPGTPVSGYKADTVTNTLALTDNYLVKLTVSGDQAFSFAAASTMTKLVTIDASANTAGVTIDASALTQAVAIKGTAAADTITSGASGDSLTGGGGNDTFVFGAGSSSIGTGTFDTITDFKANTYGNGTSGAVDSTGANLAKLNGSILSFAHAGTGAGGVVVDVLTSAADATTFLSNHHSANTVVAALDSANNNLYVDNTGDGVADFYIHLTGVTTINAAAFTLS